MNKQTNKIRDIINGEDLKLKRALFSFNSNDDTNKVILKFNLWARYNLPDYFSSEDAPFHRLIDINNLRAYRGEINSFTDIVFRGGAKTARTKMFLAFCIANDEDHTRRYIKILAYDKDNSKQITTDIYNILISPKVSEMYPEIFQKTTFKREEKMEVFTTSTGVKVIAETVGVDQRGALQEYSRPDLIWYEDFENRKTLWSATITHTIWQNMEEARTSLAVGGACIYTCNYVSEMGNVHRLVQKEGTGNILLIQPITVDGTLNGEPVWSRYPRSAIDYMVENDEDFEGERLCKPSASKDAFFDREQLEKMEELEPIKIIAEFKVFKEFNASHRYGSGHDVAGGVGLDSSTSVLIDFSTVPCQVVGTFNSNTIAPESFGYEVHRQGEFYSLPIAGIENNKYDQAILAAKQQGCNLYRRQPNELKLEKGKPKEYGWNTNHATKRKMLFDLRKAIEDGHIALNDKNLIAEAKAYTRNDLIDKEVDSRLTTRHFDLLTACAIAWQMRDHATVKKVYNTEQIAVKRGKYGEYIYE